MINLLLIFTIYLVCVLTVRKLWVAQNQVKRKEKPKRTPEGQWMLSKLYETQATYGHAYRVFVLTGLWNGLTVAEQNEVKELLFYHHGYCLKVTRHGRSTMSIIQQNGQKFDFNYGKKKRG
jgi:hypothetical protein